MSVYRMLKAKIKVINYGKLDELSSIIAKENNKSKLFVKWDMIYNFIIYGTGYTDYFKGNYINLTRKEKKTFVTTKTFYNLLKYLNDFRYLLVLRDKTIFDKMFNKYLGRGFIDLKVASLEEFKQFIENKKDFFVKAPYGYGGHGVEKVITNEIKDVEKLYTKLKRKKQFLIEETIIQNDVLNQINPCVVNTFRVVTLFKDSRVYIVGNALRINKKDDEVVGSTDDMYFTLNENGKVSSNVLDDYGHIYDKHPLTGVVFKELTIPYVKEAFDLAKKVAKELPQIRYIGWDIAITPKGPVILEGNEYPSYGIIQYYLLNYQKEGHLKTIEKVLKDEMKNIKL